MKRRTACAILGLNLTGNGGTHARHSVSWTQLLSLRLTGLQPQACHLLRRRMTAYGKSREPSSMAAPGREAPDWPPDSGLGGAFVDARSTEVSSKLRNVLEVGLRGVLSQITDPHAPASMRLRNGVIGVTSWCWVSIALGKWAVRRHLRYKATVQLLGTSRESRHGCTPVRQ